MAAYAVNVTREDGMWVAVVGGLPVNTFAAYEIDHFSELDDAVRSGLADLIGDDDFHLDWHFSGSGLEFTESLVQALEAADEAERSREALARSRSAAIQKMRLAGLSLRDIADALQMSHQRVSQLVST
ncbi:MerR [Pseudonocardia nantongensis]|uniref:MerR n=1 Tax=Pseudonocardia nantongensis TaxID=1181885 RepID=UPI00397C4735